MDWVLLTDTQLGSHAAEGVGLCCFPELQKNTQHWKRTLMEEPCDPKKFVSPLISKQRGVMGLDPIPRVFIQTHTWGRTFATLNHKCSLLVTFSRTSSFHQTQTCQTATFQPPVQERPTDAVKQNKRKYQKLTSNQWFIGIKNQYQQSKRDLQIFLWKKEKEKRIKSSENLCVCNFNFNNQINQSLFI